MGERCARHGLAAGPDGRCVLCRREGDAGERPPASDRASRLTVGNLAIAIALAALVGLAVQAWRRPSGGSLFASLAERLTAAAPAAASERFTSRHPLDSPQEQLRRGGLTPEPPFVLEQESFQLIVPDGAGASQALGLLVWIDAGASGAVPRADWLPVLARHRLAWAGPNGVGNTREVTHRIGLALAALQAVGSRHALAAGRVFVGGFSGGAKSAQRALFMYPDVFAGGVFFAGADYFRDIPAPSHGPSSRWPARFGQPLLFDAARARPCALVTGSADPNLGQMSDVHAAMSEDGFSYARLFVHPGLGHTPPDGAGFEEALHAVGAAR